MSPRLLGSLSLLLLGPAVAFAQSTPRVYVGASATLIYAAPFSSYNSTSLGPAATLGVQLAPRWALETGFQFFWQNRSASYMISSYETDSKIFLIPLLARYTFTDDASRLQVDMLGGGSWLHSSYRTQYTYFNSNNQAVIDSRRGTSDAAALTLGPQVRYELGSNFEVKLSLPINLFVNGGGSFTDRLYLSPQLGMQYTFGQ